MHQARSLAQLLLAFCHMPFMAELPTEHAAHRLQQWLAAPDAEVRPIHGEYYLCSEHPSTTWTRPRIRRFCKDEALRMCFGGDPFGAALNDVVFTNG